MRSVQHIIDSWSTKQWTSASAILLFALGFLLYGRTLSYAFVELDDPLLILENAAVQSFSWVHLKTIFTTYDPELYIPLTFLSYQFDIAIGGLHPFLIHLHNLLQHILNTGLFGVLAYMLLKSRSVALFAALLFLVHPIHVEAVVWATGRKDLLSTTLFLLSLLTYIRYARHGWQHHGEPEGSAAPVWYFLSIICFLFGLLSKVSIISLPVVLFLIDWLEGRKITRRSILEKIPYFALALIFGIIALFGKIDAPDLPLLTRILVSAKSFIFSMEKIVIPTGLSPMYAYAGSISLRSGDFLLSLLLVIAVISAAYMVRKRWKICAFSVAFTMITFLPSFGNLIKNGDYYLTADRYAYIPSMGLFMIVAFLLMQAEKRISSLARRGTLFIAILFLLFLSILSYKQSTVWSDSETLSRYVTQISPNARLGHLWYGNALRDAGKIDEALAEYNVALSFKDDAQVYYDRALAYELNGETDAAVADHEKALELSPAYALAHINLGRLLYQRGEKEDARKHFVAAAEESPYLAMPFYNLGVLEGERKQFDRAAEFYRQALGRDPDLHDARANLAIALLELGKTAEAMDQLKETLRRDPPNATARGVLQELIEQGIVRIGP